MGKSEKHCFSVDKHCFVTVSRVKPCFSLDIKDWVEKQCYVIKKLCDPVLTLIQDDVMNEVPRTIG